MAPQPEVDADPGPDLLGSILSGQSFLMMNGADIVIHRDGSLSAKSAGEEPLRTARRPHLCAPGDEDVRSSRDSRVV